MNYTYPIHEVIELIDQASKPEILALCDLIKEERSYYSTFHLKVIAAAINIHLDTLQMSATG